MPLFFRLFPSDHRQMLPVVFCLIVGKSVNISCKYIFSICIYCPVFTQVLEQCLTFPAIITMTPVCILSYPQIFVSEFNATFLCSALVRTHATVAFLYRFKLLQFHKYFLQICKRSRLICTTHNHKFD